MADFGEGLAENGKAGPLEALRRRDKEVFCESGYSRTITWCPQLRFATPLADFGEGSPENGKTGPLEALTKGTQRGFRQVWLFLNNNTKSASSVSN